MGRGKKIPQLSHQVKLEGAKYPHDVFTIDLPAAGMSQNNIYLPCIMTHAICFLSPLFLGPNSQPAETFRDLSAAGVADKLTIH